MVWLRNVEQSANAKSALKIDERLLLELHMY
jgi:hypothetical protein